MRTSILIASLALLGACHQSASDNAADQLENAADQSDPAAAEVLENAADRIRDGDDSTAPAAAQNAMSAAGAAQTPATSSSMTQAKPHAAGDPVPPPQTGGSRR